MVASLKRLLRSDVPVGLFLSSGTDSGIIAGILNKLKIDNVKVFTLGFKGYKSESSTAFNIARSFNFEVDLIELTEGELIGAFKEYYEKLRAPICDPAAVGLHVLCKKASEIGVKVVLTGDGADE